MPVGKRKQRRPKKTWRRTVERERWEAGWQTWGEVRVAASDTDGWHRSVEALCASRHEGDR